jgi:hypothetical protein
MTEQGVKSTPKCEKSKKSFVADIIDEQRLTQKSLGPFFITAWPAATYEAIIQDAKKPPRREA